MWTNLYVVTRSDHRLEEVDGNSHYTWTSYPARIFDNEKDAIEYRTELRKIIAEFKDESTVRIDVWWPLADGFGWEVKETLY